MALASRMTVSAGAVPEYKVGDIAKEQIITPIQLAVVDQSQTAALKSREASRAPLVCRYYTNALDEAEANFRSAFAAARTNCIDRLGLLSRTAPSRPWLPRDSSSSSTLSETVPAHFL